MPPSPWAEHHERLIAAGTYDKDKTMATHGRLTVTDTAGDGTYSVLRREAGVSSRTPDIDVRSPQLAARLAASYNACRSVPLDVLERIDVGRLVETARKLERDLREAFEDGHSDGLPPASCSFYADELRAALGETEA